jgi:hypothetical protein
MYGLDIPGGAILAVLHDDSLLAKVRKASATAARQAAAILRDKPKRKPPKKRR